MKKEIQPVIVGVVVTLVILIALGIVYVISNRQSTIPDKKMPSGPIFLPKSQIGRPLPGGGIYQGGAYGAAGSNVHAPVAPARR